MKSKGKATPKKGVDIGTERNRSNLTIKLLITDLIIYWKSPTITNKYLPKIRASYYAIITRQLLLLIGYLPYYRATKLYTIRYLL
jgi:hypothetical protein